ncbi:MAG: hypothetical protein AUK35_00715 [Zetaproteobacteria bacterium CG2_30_46_52]|nr:MAG: hypothetical protein AUK35_00715 [Zetaproteobacteria bacterium CG2_30_46_52]
MSKTAVVWGIGEIGSVFARGLMRLGYTIVPVTSSADPEVIAKATPSPELVLIAVGEATLQSVLSSLPAVWADKVGMIQNELLPVDWQKHPLENPTVVSVWFEKKKGMDAKPVISSPAWGPHAATLVQALNALDIPAHEVATLEDMTYELVRKNVYIISTNVAGLKVGGNVAELWANHEDFARDVVSDVIDIQEVLVGESLPTERLITGMLEAFDGDPNHGCMGRSAPARLARAITQADTASLATPTLREIAKL